MFQADYLLQYTITTRLRLTENLHICSIQKSNWIHCLQLIMECNYHYKIQIYFFNQKGNYLFTFLLLNQFFFLILWFSMDLPVLWVRDTENKFIQNISLSPVRPGECPLHYHHKVYQVMDGIGFSFFIFLVMISR